MAQFYGWSYESILKLPMPVFTRMYTEANKMEAAQYRELLDISMASCLNIEYYKERRHRYNRMIFKDGPQLPESPPAMVLGSHSPDRKDIVLGIFNAAKRGMGYG